MSFVVMCWDFTSNMERMDKPVRFPLLIMVCVLLASIQFAKANTIVSGSTANGASATATFTFHNGTVDITITNTTAVTTMETQALQQVLFDLSSPASGGSVTSSANLSYVDINGHPNATVTPDTSNPALLWTVQNGNTGFDGHQYGFDLLPVPSNSELIIGSGTTFNWSGNPSPHNPYLAGSPSFTLTIAGVTTNTTVKQVEFLFGTSPSADASVTVHVPSPPAVPLPSTVIAGTGLFCMLGIGKLINSPKLRSCLAVRA